MTFDYGFCSNDVVKSPCKGCKDRRISPVNCHTECERYLESVDRFRSMRKLKYDEDRGLNNAYLQTKGRMQFET